MAKKPILITVEEDVIEQIDAVVPKGERSAWIEQLCIAALAGGAPLATATPPTDDALVWRTACAALLQILREGSCEAASAEDCVDQINAYAEDGWAKVSRAGGGMEVKDERF